MAIEMPSLASISRTCCRPVQSLSTCCRKIGATRAAENGASVAQPNAIFGWSGTAMASLYTQAADRKRLTQEAMTKVVPENETTTSIPSPGQEVRVAERKSK